MRNINQAYYAQLTSRERVKLMISATVNNDQEEIMRLWRNSPMHLYKLRDPECKKALIAYNLVCSRFFQLIVFYYNKIQALEMYLMLLPEQIVDSSEFELFTLEKHIQDIANKQQQCIAMIKAIYYALDLFCEETELNITDVIKISKIEQTCDLLSMYLSSNIDADEPTVLQIKDEFLGYWSEK